MSGAVRASVLIPSYQSATTIHACLTSVLAQEFDGEFEVFLTDSGTDATAEIVRRDFPKVHLLKSDTRVSAERARNLCARDAKGTLFAFIDSDCVAKPDWLARLCQTLEAGTYQGVGGAIQPVDRSNDTCWAGYFCEFREFLPRGGASEATYLTPNNAAYLGETFRSAGGFPDGYFPQEDQVFYRHLHAVGARIRFDPSIVVKHNHRDKVSAFLKHQTTIGTANARVVRELGLQGAGIVAHPWLAAALMPALAVYRFARTFAACWRQERFLMLRRPAVPALCLAGMFAWGVGFARGSQREARRLQAAT